MLKKSEFVNGMRKHDLFHREPAASVLPNAKQGTSQVLIAKSVPARRSWAQAQAARKPA